MEQTLSNRRRYLTADELEKLIKAARKGHYGRRNATLMLLMARHGLRVTEAVDLRWDQIDFSKGHLHVRRLKGGIHSVHPIQGDELRALRELKRDQTPESAFVFTSERGGPMTRSNVAKLIDNAGKRAGLPHCHPHQLRHTCGHLLADAGHDTRRLQLWLGHSDIKHEEAKFLASIAQRHAYNLVHLIYRPRGYEGDSKDYEFSRLSMEHWRSGYHDAMRTLRHPEVLERAGNGDEVTIFDFAGDGN